MKDLMVTFKTPTRILFDGKAKAVRLKTDLGLMEILPNHATFVGTILYSQVEILSEEASKLFVMRQGSLAVNENGQALILASEAEKKDEVSIDDMKEYLTYLAEQLEHDSLTEYQKKFLEEQRKALQENLDDE